MREARGGLDLEMLVRLVDILRREADLEDMYLQESWPTAMSSA
jgi:hypothetical protein